MSRWLVTRPAVEAEDLAAALAARGHEAVIAPLLTIDYAVGDAADGPDLARLADRAQALLFTSVHGVHGFVQDADCRHQPVLAVGDSTAAAARRAGFLQVISAQGNAEDLARLVLTRLDPARGPLLHPSGEHLATDLALALTPAGFDVHRITVYHARSVSKLPESAASALAAGNLAGVLFFSPRTAEVFDRLTRSAGLTDRLASLTALCLSPAVARRLQEQSWAAVRVAARPNAAALLALTGGSNDSSP